VICLYDAESDVTTPKVMRTAEGIPDEPIAISSNIANDVIRRRQSLLVQDTRLDERFGGADSVILMNIRSAMCAPLYRQGNVVGFVYVDRQSAQRPFSATDLHALSTLALLSAVAVEKAALRDGLRREKEVRSHLARYSSPAVVDRIVEQSEVAARGMSADECEVTVLFADLTEFTAMAESMKPAQVVQMLNSVFERLTEVIFEFEGTLDKFRGDGLMAFFGAPLPMPDHARRAVGAALRMQELLSDVNEYSSPGRRLAMRIGINSGPVVVGDIGSPQRKDYTVIGDTVNTASRLESSVARPGDVVIGPTTREQLGDDFRCQPLEETALKGKRERILPYLVLGVGDGDGKGA
jgi:adenylate cyclase